MFILSNIAVLGRFADGYETVYGGRSEAECVEGLANMQEKHGELTFYSTVDDDFVIDFLIRHRA